LSVPSQFPNPFTQFSARRSTLTHPLFTSTPPQERTLDPELVHQIISTISTLVSSSTRLLKQTSLPASIGARAFAPLATQTTMPSLEPSTALIGITSGSQAANTLKGILDRPLRFERTSVAVQSGILGRYTPLNTPFTLENGTNGVDRPRSSSTIRSLGDITDGPEENGVNGDSEQKEWNGTISTEWTKELIRPAGLRNLSNTCYMNSTLQALMHVPPLVNFCLQRIHTSHCSLFDDETEVGDKGVRTCLFCRIEKHAIDSYRKGGSGADPRGIVGRDGRTNPPLPRNPNTFSWLVLTLVF
jgi:hypothetical protein